MASVVVSSCGPSQFENVIQKKKKKMLSAEGEIYLEYLEEFYTCREY